MKKSRETIELVIVDNSAKCALRYIHGHTLLIIINRIVSI